jgi:hypothetical protein
MVINIFSQSEQHPEPGGIVYSMRNPTARVLRGDPVVTQAVIDATPSYVGQRFTAGVACETEKLTNVQENTIADELDYNLRGGRPPEAVGNCLIAHGDKGKSEIHFITPHLDLLLNKIVNPYIDRFDRHRFCALTEAINLEFGFQNPLDHRRIEPFWEHMRINNDDKFFLQRVWHEVEHAVEKGIVCNRSELAAFLHAKGYEIRVEKHAGGPLEQPVILSPSGSQLRLKGSIYYAPNFGIPQAQTLDGDDPAAVAHRIKHLKSIIHSGLEFRAYWTIGRLFGRAAQTGVEKGAAQRTLDTLLRPHLDKLHEPKPALKIFTSKEVESIQTAKEIRIDLTSIPILVPGVKLTAKHSPATTAATAVGIPTEPEFPIASQVRKSEPKAEEAAEKTTPTPKAPTGPPMNATIVVAKRSKRKKPRRPSTPSEPDMQR